MVKYEELFADYYASAYAEAQKGGRDEAYCKAYAETCAEESAKADIGERIRLEAILTSPEAERAPELAQYFAFETSDPAAKAVAVMRVHAGSGPAQSRDTSASYEERKRAAGALGLAPVEASADSQSIWDKALGLAPVEASADSQSIWDKAIVRLHKMEGVENPEIGATGRKLQ